MTPGLTGAIAAGVLAAAAPSDGPAHMPVSLETEVIGDAVTVRVIGHAAATTEARYTLAVSSRSGGGNRSVQSGRARLVRDRRVTLLTLRMASARSSDWSARLQVTPAGADDYVVEMGPKGPSSSQGG